ncbi:tail fiber protein [Escherichia coli]|nr:tail fiber protein [Escherichia coli]QOS02144.1 tail fiber protein [Escherichia coli]
MNDVTVVTSVTYPSPESLALVADVQYHEPYLSAALNRKFRGIVDPGFYAGFLPKPGGGMNLLITSVDGDKTAGAASVDIGEFYQVTIQHRKDISLALNAGKKYAIVLKGRYLLGEDTYQVNTASHIHAAEFVARTYTDSYQLGDGELLVCTVNIPAGVSTITQEMIDTSERINRTIGIDISDSVTSTRSDVAASSLAVKKAYDLAKSKYTAQDASTTQKGLVQLSSATNSTSEVLAATPKAVKAAYDLANGKYTAQDATTAQKGIVQLSSDTNSTSETLAATPKAVKAAYDLAAGKAPSSHTHPWNQITGVPTASLTAKGITQLSSATDSTSEVLAATPKAVKAAYDLANGKYTAQDATTAQKGIVQLSSDTNSTSETLAATPKAVKAAYDLAAGKAPSSHTHPWNQITGVPTASLTAKGITQLSSATDSTSEVLAATPKAVKAAYDLANGKYTAQDATTAQKGIVQLSSDTNSTSETLAATPKAVKAAYDLAAGKAPSSHTHPWNQITGVPTASLTAKGITQLSSATDSTSEVLAATPKAVKAAYDLANGKYTAQDATTAQKGIVQLSSDTNSTSETLAATPKAVKAAYDLAAGKAPSSHTHPWNQITGVPTASLTAKGITQLSSATDSTSEVLAATPKAVKAAYDLANGKYTAQDATTAQKGIVQLSSDTNSTSETLAATPKAVKAAYDLAAGKAPSSHTHPWNQITGVPTASLTAKGITQLSSATDSTSEVLAATPKAVKAAYDLANGKYTAQDATTAQKGIVQLSSATNSTSEVLAATPKAVKAAYDLANGKQAADATLTALAALATAADKLPYFTGVDRAALTALTSVGRAILGKTSIQSVLDYLGLGEGSALPVGVPVPWPLETPPTGWLKCNGAAFSSEMYPKLAKAYPTNKLPDLRGEFIRGWDDGRGVDAGRQLLSSQGDAIRNIEGFADGGIGMSFDAIRGAFYDAGTRSARIPNNTTDIGKTDDLGFDASRVVPTANENRPRNIAFNYIVRAA